MANTKVLQLNLLKKGINDNLLWLIIKFLGKGIYVEIIKDKGIFEYSKKLLWA